MLLPIHVPPLYKCIFTTTLQNSLNVNLQSTYYYKKQKICIFYTLKLFFYKTSNIQPPKRTVVDYLYGQFLLSFINHIFWIFFIIELKL